MRLSLVIPIFNESQTVGAIVRDVLSTIQDVDCILVDDGSTDGSSQIAAEEGARVIRHPVNMGNGAAVKSGIRAAGSDILVFMDGDGQHEPADIEKLLAYIDHYDMVVGARSTSQQATLARGWMNYLFNRLASYVTGYPIDDLTSGFRAIKAKTAREILPMLPNGYSWPTTSTLVLLRSGLSVKYVPINLRPRQHGRSRIRPVRDSMRFFLIILKICTLYSPLRIFLPVSATMFGLGLVNYIYTYITAGRFTNMSALMFSTSVIIFMMGLISEQISQISLLRKQVSFPKEKDDAVNEQASDQHNE